MEIPYTQLSEDTLRAVIEEYITREGTDYVEQDYSLEQKVQQLKSQLQRREVLISYDPDTQTCHLLPAISQT